MARTPDTCPSCGTLLRAGARACPDCGADERTGWSDDAVADRLGLPSDPDTFDHAEWERSEFGDSPGARRNASPAARSARRRRMLWTCVAAALLLAIAVGWLRSGLHF